MDVKFSLIIATYNRLEELKELFASLNALLNRNLLEVIVVDDGSTDLTEHFITSFSADFPIRYFKQKNKGPGAARNNGMSKAKGEYFIFIDSDVILPEDYIRKIDDALEQNKFDAFGGPDTYHESFSDLLKAINYSMTSFLGTGGTRGSKKSVTKFYPRSFNMGIHRKVYEEIGGMNDLRHGQDMDFSARIYKAGFKVGLINDAFVYHKRRTSFWKFFKQIHNWGVTRINLQLLHKNMLKPVHLLPAFIVLGGCVILLLSFFFVFANKVLYLGLLVGLAVALLAFMQSFFMYKSIKISCLSVLTLFIQVFAYGCGLINACLQILFGAKQAKGITKNYYK